MWNRATSGRTTGKSVGKPATAYRLQKGRIADGVYGPGHRLVVDQLVRAQARRVNRRMIELLDDFDPLRFTALNREFHFVFYRRCGDQHLHDLIESEWDRLDLIRQAAFALVPDRPRISVLEHDALLDLIERAPDFDAVEAAARQHKLNTLLAVYRHDAVSPGALVPESAAS